MSIMDTSRHIIPISGKDSLATAILQRTHKPDLPYEYMFNPTGLELPEIEGWLQKVEHSLGIKITRVGRPLHDIIVDYNYFLPSGRARYCTKESKIWPMLEWLGTRPANVYYGIRADENREGFNNTASPHITPVYPLQQFNIDLQGVYSILRAKDLKPPTFYWERLHQEVRQKIGYEFRDIIPEWLFDRFMAYRKRPNCDRCFFQAYIEWVGLLWHHPDRFWEAESWEKKGAKDGELYTWNSNQTSLAVIAERADQIFAKHVKMITKKVRQVLQGELFVSIEANTVDLLEIKGCGLFCGK